MHHFERVQVLEAWLRILPPETGLWWMVAEARDRLLREILESLGAPFLRDPTSVMDL